MSPTVVYAFLGWRRPTEDGPWSPGPSALRVGGLKARGLAMLQDLADSERGAPSTTDPSVPLARRLEHLCQLMDEPDDAIPTKCAFAAVRLAAELIARGAT